MRFTSRLWPSPLRPTVSRPLFPGTQMPGTLWGFVWGSGAWDQVWLALLSIAVSVLGTLPIEVQRRIINEAVKQKNLDAIAILSLTYAGLVLAQGLLKLLTNLYRSWIGANSVRRLRTTINALSSDDVPDIDVADSHGIKISIIVSESDAVGGFVGQFLAEPVLGASVLLSVFGYLFVLQPVMALVSLGIFIPQVVFVPLLQNAINRRVETRIATLRQASGDVIADQAGAPRIHDDRFQAVFGLDMGINKLKFFLNFLMNITQHFGTVMIVALGAWFVVKGETQVGTVVAFLSGLSTITDPWGDLVTWFQDLMMTGAKYGLVRDAVAKMAMPETPAH